MARPVDWLVRKQSATSAIIEQYHIFETIDTSENFKDLLKTISDSNGHFVLFLGPGISLSLYKDLCNIWPRCNMGVTYD